jgi:hypothetical protein
MEQCLEELRAACAPWLADVPTIAGLDTFSLVLGLGVGLGGFIVLSMLMGALSAVVISAVVYLLSADISTQDLMDKVPQVDIPDTSEVLDKLKEQKAVLEEKMADQVKQLEEIIE